MTIEEGAVSKLVYLDTDDRKYTANIGVFAGRANLAVFDNNVKTGPVIKMLFTLTSLYQFKSLLKKVVADSEMKPVELGSFPYNPTTKTFEFRSSITIGRDNDKCIYLDMASIDHKEPIRVLTITDKSVRLNNKELPKQYASELGANVIVDTIDQLINQGMLNTWRKPSKQTSGSYNAPPSDSSDDLPF